MCSSFSFASTPAIVDKPVGNNSCFAMVMTNRFWAQQQNRNHRIKYHLANSTIAGSSAVAVVVAVAAVAVVVMLLLVLL